MYKTNGPSSHDTKRQRSLPNDFLLLALVCALATLIFFSFQGVEGGSIDGSVFAQEPDSGGIAPAIPPIRTSTPSGTYTVELDWQPESAEIGQETIYLVRFLDESGDMLTSSRITYDFEIVASNGSLMEGFYAQETEDDGIGRPLIMEFEKGGPVSMTAYIHSMLDLSSGDNTPIEEGVTFNMTVVPEFSVSVLLLVLAVITGIVVLLGRMQIRTLVQF